MRRFLFNSLICVLLTFTCAFPGTWIAYAANDGSFLGIGILGGLIGLLLGLGPIIYHTTLAGSLRRVAKGFVWTIVKYNLDDVVDPAPIVAGERDASELLRRDAPPLRPEQNPYRYADRGAWMGGILGVVLAVAGACYFHISDQAMGRGWLLFLLALLGLAFGTMNGMAVAMLLVPGRHRLNIAIALVVGLAIAAAMSVRLSSGARDPTSGTVGLFVLLPTICVFVATLAHETAHPGGAASAVRATSSAMADVPPTTASSAEQPPESSPGEKTEPYRTGHQPSVWPRVIGAVGLIAGLVSFVASQMDRDSKATERAQEQETRNQERIRKDLDRLQKIGPLVASRTPEGKSAIMPKLLPQLLGRWRLSGEAEQGLEFRTAGTIIRFDQGAAPIEGSFHFVQGDTLSCSWPTAGGNTADETWRVRISDDNTLEVMVIETNEVRRYLRESARP